MESTITLEKTKFKAGNYYIGDPGYVLPVNNLRVLFSRILHYPSSINGVTEILTSSEYSSKQVMGYYYWSCILPIKKGTIYDQTGKGYGIEFGSFSCIPSQFVQQPEAYSDSIITFDTPFECFKDDNKIYIGNFNFSL
jgi:hypothetical protein